MPASRISLALLAALLAVPQLALAQTQLAVQVVATGLASPVGFVPVPGSPTTQVIVEHGGRIRVLEDGALQATDFIDLTADITPGGEKGLLSLAFSPGFAVDGRFFVSYVNLDGNLVVSRFLRASGPPLAADPASRFDLAWPTGERYIWEPAGMHFGGHLAFGPDGYLYLGLGDGGTGDDLAHLAQNPLDLHGKMLRLDVNVAEDDPEGYDVPAGNPFVNVEGVLPEIWALGLRNPWRWSFDDPALGGTGALIIADVGQELREEIDYEPAGRGGRNYGWRNKEGFLDYIPDPPLWSGPTDPIIDFSRTDARSLIGGFVYRGQTLGPSYTGRYFAADFVTGNVWSIGVALDENGEATVVESTRHESLVPNALRVSSFGTDASGEIYLVNYVAGTVSKVVLAPIVPACPLPDPYAALGGGRCVGGTWLPPVGNVAPAPVRVDINGDGRSDFLWQHETGLLYAWAVDAFTVIGGGFLTPNNADPLWQAVAASDFTGDGKPEIVFQHAGDGRVRLWSLDGTTVTGEYMLWPLATPWRVVATGDFNRDGWTDLLWQNPATGQLYVWFITVINGVPVYAAGDFLRSASGPVAVDPSAPWRIAGTGDFDGDGMTDLLWQHDTAGYLGVWYMDTVVLLNALGFQPAGVSDPNWKVRSVGDYSGDGKPDLIWQNDATGGLWQWILSGPTMIAEAPFSPSGVHLAWRIVGQR